MRLRELVGPTPIALRLPLRFDPERLRSDALAMEPSWWQGHLSDYHDGQWQSISLYAPGGERTNQFSFGGEYAATEALARCAYLPSVLDLLPGKKSRVRLLRLRAGGHIHAHSDPLHQIDPGLVRLHVPIQTDPAVDFRVNGIRLSMAPGELWFVDVRFRHSVANEGTQDRVHLVVDVVASEGLRALFATAAPIGMGYLTAYHMKHMLPRRLIRWLNIGN